MKKLLLCLVLGAAALGCCVMSQRTEPLSAAWGEAWKGRANFLDRDLASEYGDFAVDLTIDDAGKVVGRVGSAELSEATAHSNGSELVIEGLLDSDVFDSGSLSAQGKDHVVLILTSPAEAASEGNLHLKSNGVFDFTMRVCGLKLERSE